MCPRCGQVGRKSSSAADGGGDDDLQEPDEAVASNKAAVAKAKSVVRTCLEFVAA